MESFPRPLRPKEKDLIEFVLPSDRPGYRTLRDLVSSMVVLGEGRRGKGNLVLGFEGDQPDTQSSLSHVIAYGGVETTLDTYTITVRDYVEGQLDVEILSSHAEQLPDHYEEKRRWTYSTWVPGNPSPATGERVREVAIGENVVLAVVKVEKRTWAHDKESGMNVLIPISHLYNELMILSGIRDPAVALNAKLFYEGLDSYTDKQLAGAFLAYNSKRPKVDTKGETNTHGSKSLFQSLFSRPQS